MKIKTKLKKTLALLTSALILIIVVSCTGNLESTKPKAINKYTELMFLMSTVVTQTIYVSEDVSEVEAKAIIQTGFDLLQEYENKMSLYIDSSEIVYINKHAGVEFVKVSKECYDILFDAVEYSKRSSGNFDVTIAPITLLWGINSDAPKLPSQEEINKLLPLVNYENILFDEANSSVMLKERGMQLDLGAIAKGASCENVRQLYKEKDIFGGILSIGGNVLTYGIPGLDREFFNVGIRQPIAGSGGILGVLETTGTVIASSGGYERFFEEDGVVYNHIFDPATGYSMESDFVGVTIVTKNGAYADFMSTYLYALSLEEMLEIKNNNLNLDYEFIAIDHELNVYVSAGLIDIFTPENEEGVFNFIDFPESGEAS